MKRLAKNELSQVFHAQAQSLLILAALRLGVKRLLVRKRRYLPSQNALTATANRPTSAIQSRTCIWKSSSV